MTIITFTLQRSEFFINQQNTDAIILLNFVNTA